LIRFLHENRHALPQRWTSRELRSHPVGQGFFVREGNVSKKVVWQLVNKGLLTMESRDAAHHVYGLVDLPPVPVHVGTTLGHVKRLAAWMAYVSAHKPEKGRGRVMSVDLLVHFPVGTAERKRVKGIAACALRAIAEADSNYWSLSTAENSGRVALSVRVGAAGPVAAVAAGAADRLAPLLRSAIEASPMRATRLRDLPRQEVAAAMRSVLEGAKAAKGVLAVLCSESRIHRRLFVDLGVYHHHRWITTPEHKEYALLCVEHMRLHEELLNQRRLLRAILRCEVKAVRDERIGELRDRWLHADELLQRHPSTTAMDSAQWLLERRLKTTALFNSVRRLLSTETDAMVLAVDAVARTDDQPPFIPRADVLSAARSAISIWKPEVGHRALAMRVMKHARRFETIHTAHGGRRVGLAGRYSVFEMRALILTIVADRESRRLAHRVRRKLGPSPSLAALLAGLAEASVSSRILAAAGLGIFGGTVAVEALRRAAIADEDGVSEIALWGLSLTKPDEAERIAKSRLTTMPDTGRSRVAAWVEAGCVRGVAAWG
jgi:hypothetical protein